jgi:tRNA nucleotidyltransferase/poly(A) polymerase
MNAERIEGLKALVRAAGVDGLIIAGGAVRDAYLDIPARDIDFVVKHPGDPVKLAEIIGRVRKAAGVKELALVSEASENPYEGAFELYRSEDSGVEVVVAMVDAVDYVDGFDDDISQMWVDGKQFYATPQSRNAARSKTITVDRDQRRRFAKLKAKFRAEDGWLVQYA